MEVNIVSQTDFKLAKQNEEIFDKILKRTSELLKVEKNYTFSVIFVNDEMIHEINRTYRKIDRPTDVISFATLIDGKDEYEMVIDDCELGDIFISIDAITRQAKEYAHSFDRELSFLFTHGLLHLLGYDHMNEKDEQEMFKLQDEILDEIIKK